MLLDSTGSPIKTKEINQNDLGAVQQQAQEAKYLKDYPELVDMLVKEFTLHKDKNYFELPYPSRSSLVSLMRRGGYAEPKEQNEGMSEGTYLDMFITAPEDLANKYVECTIPEPSDTIKPTLEVLNLLLPDIVDFDNFDQYTSDIELAINQTNLYSTTNWGMPVKVKKVIAEKDYLRTIRSIGNKTPISSERATYLKTLGAEMKREIDTFFDTEDNPILHVLHKVVIIEEYFGVIIKAELDTLIIRAKSIEIIDYKLTHAHVFDFAYEAIKYGYLYQAAIYRSLVTKITAKLLGKFADHFPIIQFWHSIGNSSNQTPNALLSVVPNDMMNALFKEAKLVTINNYNFWTIHALLDNYKYLQAGNQNPEWYDKTGSIFTALSVK